MQRLKLRDATPADREFLVSLAREAYREVLAAQFDGWKEEVHGDRFAEKVATLPFRIAELDGVPVGTLSTCLEGGHLRVNEIVVSPDFQNRGLGSELLTGVFAQARAAGVPVRLHTFRLNRALAFYERHGFVVTARNPDYVDLEWTG
ncbi:MAG TPA: GNAT family N-acetyltransferase [Polyangiaceae bacterium]|nr:GNAT family N-acetyltransferase [Polyangiaceae bacterium]